MRIAIRLVTVLLAALLAGTVALPSSAMPSSAMPSSTLPGDDIVAQLHRIPGLTITKEDPSKAPPGYRYFELTFTQLADHRNPAAGTFQQRLSLLHKDTAAPMVMYTGGYGLEVANHISEPARLVGGNQLNMEYRYFAPSIPAKQNWPQQLTIWQAATDQHDIIQAFKKVYRAHWLTTGGSKGGMTATYHRRFYPGDVSGTIPYVAPNDVFDPIDSYNKFLANDGIPSCREDLKRLQRETLQRRDEVEKVAAAAAAKKGDTFTIIGSLDRSFETAVIDSYFGFWQYQNPKTECGKIPQPGASAQDIYNWYDKVDSLLSYSDQDLQDFIPYYYQAAYQLGAPEAYDSYLRDLLRYPGIDQPLSFIPKNLKPVQHDYFAMPDIDFWVRTQATNMIYIYGQFDPWSAEPFDCGPTGGLRNCHRYYVPGGNHGSTIAQLPAAQRDAATALIRKWAGVSGAPAPELRSATVNPLMVQRPRL